MSSSPHSALPVPRLRLPHACVRPARLVWGADWPHLVHQHTEIGDAAPPAGYRPVDETALLDALRASLDSAPVWRAILVDNPARLYGF